MTGGKPTIPIGVLFSSSGPYADLGREGLGGALTAIGEINDRADFPVRFSAQVRNPQGNTEAYAPLCREIVTQAGAQFVVGCTTSWSRKEVIPVLEKTGAQLWYPCPYEGFESNDHVVYVGACPNQHVVPLLDHLMPAFGKRMALVGSNYIWGWETNRIARERLEAEGGAVVMERYVPLGDTDIGHILDEIERKKPDLILNTLIGPSSHALIEAYGQLGARRPDFVPERRPVLSCNWSEPEIARLGQKAAGHFTVAPYFQSLPGAGNRQFLKMVARRYGPQPISAFFAQSYTAVHMIAQGIAATRSWDVGAVLAHAQSSEFAGPAGPVRIDPGNNHAILSPHIGRAAADGGFALVKKGVPVRPDPYLANHAALQTGAGGGGEPEAAGDRHLRVVK